MAAQERRPPTDGEVIEYIATLFFIVMVLSIITNALSGCTTALAY